MMGVLRLRLMTNSQSNTTIVLLCCILILRKQGTLMQRLITTCSLIKQVTFNLQSVNKHVKRNSNSINTNT